MEAERAVLTMKAVLLAMTLTNQIFQHRPQDPIQEDILFTRPPTILARSRPKTGWKIRGTITYSVGGLQGINAR